VPLRIAIPLGDITGIGPEVALKALARENLRGDVRFVLIGNPEHTFTLAGQLGINLPLTRRPAPMGQSAIEIFDPGDVTLPSNLAAGAQEAARAAVSWVQAGARGCLAGEFDALVTAPVNKEAIIRAGIPFVGQTEMLSQLADAKRTAMMLLGQDDRDRWLRVALATTHVPLKRVSADLTEAKVRLAIDLAAQACQQLGLSRRRVGVCGLNPHAGEGGAMGDEELTVIHPAIAAARREGVEAVGPVSADVLFYYALRGDYDAVVAMYHDQGLAPLKLVAFERGVNWTVGLPFVRTSPDHGTAYDIAGKNQANPLSMQAAIHLACQLAVGAVPRTPNAPYGAD
jgi:4-hydroxythreonine-4-phosphate dehydrogenase